MGTTADKLAYLAGTKSAIREAIIDKGVNVPDGTTFRQYASKIASIQDVGSLPTQGAKTVMPTTTEQVAVASGRYTTGDVVVSGDANLVPENIAEGVSIFGVQGTHSGGGGDREQITITVKGNAFNSIYYTVVSNGSALDDSTNTTAVITADINSMMLFASLAYTPTITAVPSGDVTVITALSGTSKNYVAIMANCDIEVT